MKILWLYKYASNYNFDHWFHMDWVYAIQKEGHECLAYGPDLDVEYSDCIVAKYDPNLTMKELKDKFDFDIVVMSTQSRMFNNYRPPLVPPAGPEVKEDCWLPSDFNEFDVPKVCLDEDSHYETNNNWFKEAGVSLVLQRHYSNVRRFYDIGNQGIKCLWLPMSVDPDIFKPDPDIVRIPKLCMASSVSHEIYVWRKKLVDTLVPKGLMESQAEQRKVGMDYVQCLKSYVGHGNCSSIFDITPAKIFEIMSSGSVLFTDNTNKYGLSHLFPKEAYVTYERDCSDMVEKAQLIINNDDLRKRVTEAGRKCILERHTHSIRINEMVDIFNKEFFSKRVTE